MDRMSLVLGPVLRYVDSTSATLFVQTEGHARVRVECGGVSTTTSTFRAHDHHYALILLEGLTPDSAEPYTVHVDDEQVWPEPGSQFPAPRISTPAPDKRPDFLFGSCRTSVSHDKEGTKVHGVDALRSYAYEMARNPHNWPDFLLFLGDQLYADNTSPAMQEFIEKRRGTDEEPGEEIKDFVEYAELYRLAWSEPANRWLLSTMPSAMIFDDHDVRDDWNTSYDWHQEMRATSWWQERIVGALGSYWIYQHAGNLNHTDLRADEVYRVIADHDGPDELDITELLDLWADRVDKEPTTYRFSFSRELGGSKLIVIDSRAARDLRPDHRAMLDEDETRWLDEEMTGDVDHLLIGTSIPFYLPTGINDLEMINETLTQNGGKVTGFLGEKIRQMVDLEHWAAFHTSFVEVNKMVLEVAAGKRGKAPATICFLSGDVHNSYVNEVHHTPEPVHSRIVQAVCSPIRNPLPMPVRALQGQLSGGLTKPMRALAKRVKGVELPTVDWSTTYGPWFDNNLGRVEAIDDERLLLTWARGVVENEQYDDPQLERVSTVVID